MKNSEQTGSAGSEATRAGPIGLARSFIRLWAIVGGLMLIAIVLMTASSVVSGFIFSKPFPGDFEIVQMGVAVAAFAFLPYCQLEGANVTVDIFTTWAPPRLIDGFRMFSALIATAIALLLFFRMWDGMADYQKYNETTPIVEIPIWYVYPPILFSLALLFLASLVTIAECWGRLSRSSTSSL
ncbi:TRAP transporter small permease [Breoghania sp. L-A4]|uniref:TRAP transporter small permease n=1 Tax=Breoghania sp. L-A4 TaxID=2304600 RepID=UPI000E35C2E3|nr:TRAP transporter small permease [Breoghania sp. L-A4]AXS40382.1 TRAP transporter small permease [Breoghania sp. L-A4]